MEFDAAELASGNAMKGLPEGLGTLSGDVRLEIETELQIVPSAYVRAADGTLNAMHDTVRAGVAAGGGGGYHYRVPIFNAAASGYVVNLSTTAVQGAAPVDHEAFDARFATDGIQYLRGEDRFTFTAQAGDRFTESGESAGAAFANAGSFRYQGVRPDAGLVTLIYDDGAVCRTNLYFESPTDDRSYTVGAAIDPLTLPEATGGNGTLRYSLLPEVPGLSFDPDTRQLTGRGLYPKVTIGRAQSRSLTNRNGRINAARTCFKLIPGMSVSSRSSAREGWYFRSLTGMSLGLGMG